MIPEEKKQLYSDRHKGVKEALKREKEYVSEGKGTRDWTSDEQREILSGKQPHDENGIPYQGHHMKSVSGHEVHADKPNNIQWLTREEHLAAHGGNFHNQTNGYYNPESHETELFRRYPKAPDALSLSEPIQTEGQSENAAKSEIAEQSNSHGR
jgi:hypothetical protein